LWAGTSGVGALELGSTAERVGSNSFVPSLEGRSSVGRLGLHVHATAGFVDLGFEGVLTLEITVVHPLRVYAGMKIAKVAFHEVTGDRDVTYSGKYQGATGPQASFLWKEFTDRKEGP
jgi:dCTP deaminase